VREKLLILNTTYRSRATNFCLKPRRRKKRKISTRRTYRKPPKTTKKKKKKKKKQKKKDWTGQRRRERRVMMRALRATATLPLSAMRSEPDAHPDSAGVDHPHPEPQTLPPTTLTLTLLRVSRRMSRRRSDRVSSVTGGYDSMDEAEEAPAEDWNERYQAAVSQGSKAEV